MEIMQKRGLVEAQTLGIDHEMSDGSKVYEVKFRPLDVPHKKQSNTGFKSSLGDRTV